MASITKNSQIMDEFMMNINAAHQVKFIRMNVSELCFIAHLFVA